MKQAFEKLGEQSVGVQVQYYGTTGHLENCQVGVFMSYISDLGHTLIDRRLYLPRSWAEDQSKRKKTAIPESIKFASTPQLAQQMLESAFKDGIRPAWFVADEVYGNDGSFWWWLEKTAKQPYILTVNKKQPVVIGWQRHRADDLIPQPDSQQWQRLTLWRWKLHENDTMIGQKSQLIVTWEMVSSAGYCSAAAYNTLKPLASATTRYSRLAILL